MGEGSGSSNKSVGTPAGSYTVAITATSGSLQRSTSVKLTVQYARMEISQRPMIAGFFAQHYGWGRNRLRPFCDQRRCSPSVGPNLSRAACQRPVDLRQSQAWTGGPSERKSALTSGLLVNRTQSEQIRQEIPEAEVIMISQNDPELVARQARDVNARGYVSKSELSWSLLPMIHKLVKEKPAALSERELGLQ